MTREEAIEEINKVFEPAFANYIITALTDGVTPSDKALEQEPCEDTVKYINALRKCAKEHKNDKTPTFNIRVSDLCEDTAKLLESIQTEPCEDAVSREAVLKAIEGKEYKFQVYEAIEKLPPVTPKQRTGKWVKVVTEVNSFGSETYHHECSVCRCNKSGWGEYRFCPNCGAKMEGESE